MTKKKPGAIRGRPSLAPFAPTAEQRQTVQTLAGYGVPQVDIARMIRHQVTGNAIKPDVLRDHFRVELDQGGIMANARVAQSLFGMATGRPATFNEKGEKIADEQKPIPAAAIFWMKARAGWKETDEHVHKHSGAIDTDSNSAKDQLARKLGLGAAARATPTSDRKLN